MTTPENTALQKVIKYQAQWMRWRYLFVVTGLSMIFYFFRELAGINPIGFDAEAIQEARVIYLFHLYVIGGFGSMLLGKAIFHWKGNPRDILLISMATKIKEGEATSPTIA